jgi:hypothetical protein
MYTSLTLNCLVEAGKSLLVAWLHELAKCRVLTQG